MKRRIATLEELSVFAGEIARALTPQEDRATILGLSGDLGAGKTAFTKSLARALGVEEEITSPTFVIEKRYRTTDPRFPSLVHIDAYRLRDANELARIRFTETASDPNRLIIIEWPEIVSAALPADAPILRFHVGENEERTVILPDNFIV
jgi:tRNA threonylcarbamoyladenosine biosynthesis protein TsaE